MAYFSHISILASCFIIWDIRSINHIFCILGHLALNIGFLGSAQHASIGGSGRFACSVHPLRMTDLVVSIGGSGRFACSVHSLRMLGLVVFTLTFCAYVYAYVTSILGVRTLVQSPIGPIGPMSGQSQTLVQLPIGPIGQMGVTIL